MVIEAVKSRINSGKKGKSVEAYETEEQQVEAIKKWWRENYKVVVAALVVGLGSILGVQLFQQNKQMTAEAASAHYSETLSAAMEKQTDVVSGRTEILKKDFQSSPYTSQATLIYAKTLADNGDLQGAIEQLQWVRNNTNDSALKHIAIIQNAQLLAAGDKKEQAVQLLDSDPIDEKSGFKSVRLEVKGDILASLGKTEEAKKAYDEAISGMLIAGGSVDILQIKRNDLGK